MTAKPTVEELGIDVDAQGWQRSGTGDGAIEIAFVYEPAPGQAPPAPARGKGAAARRADWVLMRMAGAPAGPVLVYDRNEWECFIDGARKGEFDAAAT